MTKRHAFAICTVFGTALAMTDVHSLHAQTTVDGLIYAHYRYGLERDSSLVPVSHPNNFELERAYLNVRSKASGGIVTRVTIDVDGRRANVNQQSIRLKYAFVDWTPDGSAITWRLGMQGTPAIGFIEDVWGYRMQGTVPIDRNRYQSSSDIGFGAEGAWRKNAVTAHAGIFNGEGYSTAPGDHRKDASALVSIRLLPTDDTGRTGGLRLSGYASAGSMTNGGARDRYLALLTYRTSTTSVGAEFWSTRDSTLADPDTKGRIFSVFATYRPAGAKLGFIARADRWDPDTERSPTAFTPAASRQTRVIGGVSYQLAPSVRLLLDADLVSAEGDAVPNTFKTANRTIYLHSEIKF
jgi:hypothetical protein